MKNFLTILTFFISFSVYANKEDKLIYSFAEQVLSAVQSKDTLAFEKTFSISISDVNYIDSVNKFNVYSSLKAKQAVDNDISNKANYIQRQNGIALANSYILKEAFNKENINTSKLKLLYVTYRDIRDSRILDYYSNVKIFCKYKKKTYVFEFPFVYKVGKKFMLQLNVRFYETNKFFLSQENNNKGVVKYKQAKKYLSIQKQDYVYVDSIAKAMFKAIRYNNENIYTYLHFSQERANKYLANYVENPFLDSTSINQARRIMQAFTTQESQDKLWYEASQISSFFKEQSIAPIQIELEDYRYVTSYNSKNDCIQFERLLLLCTSGNKYFIIEFIEAPIVNKQIIQPFKIKVYLSDTLYKK